MPPVARSASHPNEDDLNRGQIMPTLSAPSQVFFLISLALAIIAVLAFMAVIPIVQYAFWIAILGYVVLAVGCLMKGM